MASVYVNVSIECEVDDEILAEYDENGFVWAADAVSVSVDDARYLSYWVDDATVE